MSARVRRGSIIECIEAPSYIRGITLGKSYVVADLQQGGAYVKILGDDDRGHSLLTTMFRLARTDSTDNTAEK